MWRTIEKNFKKILRQLLLLRSLLKLFGTNQGTWSSHLSYLPNKLATLIAMPTLGKVILVLKRYLSSSLKEGRRPLAICSPWTGGKLKWSIKQIWSNQIEILSAYCKRYLFHASAMLSLLTNFVLRSGPVISNLNPFLSICPCFLSHLLSAISYSVFSNSLYSGPWPEKKYDVNVSKWLLLTFVALGLKSTPFQYFKPQCMVEWKDKDHIMSKHI